MFVSKEQKGEMQMFIPPKNHWLELKYENGRIRPAGFTPMSEAEIERRSWYGRRLPRKLPFLTKAGAWNAWNRGSLTPCFSLEPEEKRHVADVFTGFLVWGAVVAFVLSAWWPVLSKS